MSDELGDGGRRMSDERQKMIEAAKEYYTEHRDTWNRSITDLMADFAAEQIETEGIESYEYKCKYDAEVTTNMKLDAELTRHREALALAMKVIGSAMNCGNCWSCNAAAHERKAEIDKLLNPTASTASRAQL